VKPRLRIPLLLLLLLLLLCGVTGCLRTAKLSVGPKKAVSSFSVLPRGAGQKCAYGRVLVISSAPRSNTNFTLAEALETELFDRKIQIIDAKRKDVGESMTLDAALTLARQPPPPAEADAPSSSSSSASASEAAAILQIVRAEWLENDAARFYELDDSKRAFVEVNVETFRSVRSTHAWTVRGSTLVFQAKLINVTTGKLDAEIDLRHSTANEVTGFNTRVDVSVKRDEHVEHFDGSQLRMLTANMLLDALATMIKGGSDCASPH
jgi:hypothetical protein